MKAYRIKNKVINIDNIFLIEEVLKSVDHFNKIEYDYYVMSTGGSCMSLSLEEFNELKEVMYNSKYDDAEA